jgi:hypothetical protein
MKSTFSTLRVAQWLLSLGVLVLAMLPADAAAFCTNCYPSRMVSEYFNHYTRHYVLLSDGAEIANVANGGAGAGWVYTGNSFAAKNETLFPQRNICRFYAPPPVNSHFFTGNAQECEQLKNSASGWIYEKLDFGIDLPQGGGCAGTLKPIYRLYNNRWMFSDSNHRFVHDAALRDRLIAEGWVDEGVAFCTEYVQRDDRKHFTLNASQIRPSAECENEAINIGGCIALNQIPPLPNRIVSWVPPFYVTKDPLFSQRYSDLTGSDAYLSTAQPVDDASAVAAHSFAQAYPQDSNTSFGIHVSSLDRTRGDLASINPLYQFRTAAPTGNGPDGRFLPWAYPLENELSVSFDIDVRTIRRLNGDSHAYGHPTLQFRDMSSAQDLYVTLGTFGTGVPGKPGDFLGIDGSTGRVIVGTAFRADPLFGKRVQGDFMSCEANGGSGSCGAGKGHYEFVLTKADFARVLGFARTLNPRLSATPENYLMVNFHFNSEIYRDAELGLTLWGYSVRAFGY